MGFLWTEEVTSLEGNTEKGFEKAEKLGQSQGRRKQFWQTKILE